MRILFVEPHESSLFSFRKELLDKLIAEGHELILCIERTEKIDSEYGDKIKIIDVPMRLKTKNILANLFLLRKYHRIIKEEKPDLIISYKIKPNLYCGLYAKKIPMIANITGLGNMFKNNGLLSKIGVMMYKASFKNVRYVFFQNEDGLRFFKEHKIPIHNYRIIPGSGVNIATFKPQPLKKDSDAIHFLFASRAIKEKGFELLLDAIPSVIESCNNAHFNFLVAEEDVFSLEKARNLFKQYSDYITIINRSDNMAEIYANNDFLVSPSFYREGISNVLIESLACGRPIITTKDNPGCMEVLQDGENGFGVISNDLPSLIGALIKAARLSKDEIERMGLAGRDFVCRQFDRKIVIDTYLEVIDEISKPSSGN